MKKSRKGVRWRELLRNKLFDLVIVITGITIAYELNNAKETRDDRNLERFYLESMVVDLDKDILEYEDNLKEFSRDRNFALGTLAGMQKGADISDSIGIAVLNISSTKTFEGHNNTYSTLMTSNGLNLIEDQAIRNLIHEHYRLYASIERFETEHTDLIRRVNGHFISAIDYGRAGLVIDQRAAINTESKNLLTLCAIQLQSGIWRYEESLRKAQDLKALILSNSLVLERRQSTTSR